MFKPGDALRRMYGGEQLIAVVRNEHREGCLDGSTRNDNGWFDWRRQYFKDGHNTGWELHPNPDEVWAEFVKWKLTN